MVVRGRQLFPNLYVMLVGPPGIGKTTAIRESREILVRAGVPTAPAMVSKEKFLQLYSGVMKAPMYNGIPFIHTSYAVLLDEFSVFLRPNDLEFMTVLTDLYDCQKLFVYSTLNRKDDIRIENACLNLIGGITPKALGENFGPASIGMGFTARVFMVYSEDPEKRDLFSFSTPPAISDVAEDVASIYSEIGELKVSPAGQDYARAWYDSGCTPLPGDSRFAEYNPRRPIHWLKLSMLVAVSKGATLVEPEHLAEAKELLLEMESMMPLALEHMGANPMATAVKDLHRWMMVEHLTKRRPIGESAIRRFLLNNIPVQYHEATIDNLVTTNLIKVASGIPPGRTFIPLKKLEE